ncbi:hypothetical protein NQ317_003608 [Molorchus minor]|uniref:Uncharacterized protein n=1 Tax=Molorchus minor TaxID=1323400 RepID=A0ABQ9IXU7_9CUCU|nr:hypothetical protein NQ317_003608 [Molorchus minor]
MIPDYKTPYIKICKKSTPDLAACIKDSVNALRPKLIEGIPELDVPSIEPLPIDRIELRSGPPTARIDGNFTNIKAWGWVELRNPGTEIISSILKKTFNDVSCSKPNLAKNRFAFRLLLPHLYFKGDYDIDINVLLLKYKGQGHISGNFSKYGENVMLAYFEQNSKIWASTTSSALWAHFSMIKAMLNVENNQDIDKFIAEASDDKYLMFKVVAVMGILGACRREELCQISLNNIEDLENTLVVNISDSKTKLQEPLLLLLRLILTYISLLADSGENLRTIKRHRGLKGSSVAEGYLEDSLENKKGIACHILPNNCPSSNNSEIEHINSISSTASTNYRADVLMKAHLVKRDDGKTYFEFDKFNIYLYSGGDYFYLDNLFEQEPLLRDATNDVINQNSELFANEVRPAIQKALADIFTKIANIITKRFTYDELFPM